MFFVLDPSNIPIKIDLDPSEYKTLVSSLPFATQNKYEQVAHDSSIHQNDQKQQRFEKRDNSFEHFEIISNEQDKRFKSHSVDDLSRTSNDQTSSKNIIFSVYIHHLFFFCSLSTFHFLIFRYVFSTLYSSTNKFL